MCSNMLQPPKILPQGTHLQAESRRSQLVFLPPTGICTAPSSLYIFKFYQCSSLGLVYTALSYPLPSSFRPPSFIPAPLNKLLLYSLNLITYRFFFFFKKFLITIKKYTYNDCHTFPPNSTRLARFCKHLATITKLLVAEGDGCSLTNPNCLGLSKAGHNSLKKMKPETTLVRTNLSSGHFATTAFCKHPQI